MVELAANWCLLTTTYVPGLSARIGSGCSKYDNSNFTSCICV